MTRVDFANFLTGHKAVIEVRLTSVRGSSPRDVGASMYVAPSALFGTIGGGQLEFMAIARARAMLNDGDLSADMDVPLGPEIGQCCGGRVAVALMRMRQTDKDHAIVQHTEDMTRLPHIYVMGAGHVGRALADLLEHMPVRCIMIDPRADELALCQSAVETRLSAIPEMDIADAPAGSAFVVLTHDHALDFLLTSAALERGDAAYVGLIGSATKRAKFKSWCHDYCDGLTIDTLICPIGAGGSRDKRPSVIAALVVAEIITALTSETTAVAPVGGVVSPELGEAIQRSQTALKEKI